MFGSGHDLEMHVATEKFAHVLGYFVAAGADGWADTRVDVLGLRAETLSHAIDRGGSHAPRGTAPPGMNKADGLPRWIVEHQGHAIGRGHCQRDPPLLRENSIGLAPWPHRPDQLTPINRIGAMGPVGTPVVPLFAIQRQYIRAVDHPGRRAVIAVQIEAAQRLQTIMYYIVESIAHANRDVQALKRGPASPAETRKAAVNKCGKLLKNGELHTTRLALVSFDQAVSW